MSRLVDCPGRTPTRALLFNSRAVDAGGTGCAALCDIGAFEAQQINADNLDIVFSDRFQG